MPGYGGGFAWLLKGFIMVLFCILFAYQTAGFLAQFVYTI